MKRDFAYTDAPPVHRLRGRAILAAHPEVAPLMGVNRLSALWIVGLVAVQWLAADAAAKAPWWLVIAGAWCLGAFLNHALYVLMHECTHNLVFKSPRLNKLAGLVCDFALVVPGALAFRKYHLYHHRYLGQYVMDPDIVSQTEAQLIGNGPLGKTLWVLLLAVSQALRPMKLKALRGIPVWDRWMAANLIAQVIIDVLILMILGPRALTYLALSTLFALGLHPLGGRWIQEHYVTREGQGTYSYYGPLNKLCFNMGFHNEHHDFPSVPWNRLPQLRRLGDEYYRDLKSYRSWTAVLLKFILDPSMSGHSRIINPERTASRQP
ncbi:MAG: fatty acid desaturase [Steroidobacteraceae bacterium]